MQHHARGMRSRLVPALISTLGAAALVCAALLSAPPAASADGAGAGDPWVVSVGDSYISGEAGRWAGNTNGSAGAIDALGATAYNDNASNTAETIARCHRSHAAEVSIGGGVNSLNLACSGARTSTFTNSSGYFKPGLDFYSSGGQQGQALMLQNFAASHHVTMVALSIGGNDFEFGTIMQECVTDFLTSFSWSPKYCKNGSTVATAMSSGTVTANTAKIATAMQNIRTAMRNAGYSDGSWTLLVQNYPSPLPASGAMRYSQSGYTRQNTGGCGLWDADVDYAANTLLPTINGAVAQAAAQSGLSNVKTLDVTSLFSGRRLCENTVGLLEEKGVTSWAQAGAADATEWVNQIRTVSTANSDYFVQESLHPNYWGQLALRSCLRQAYNQGAPKGGSCARSGTGLLGGEPVVALR
ncbi:hypothetical protein [Arthrobacter woluwensis]|uniref:GDSL-like Lipase/Acylhydrolase family protein n=1 Tax=Arthrobacter woluwensis TaxID=156980 RepID=A0A1H4N7R1_9MICC|nr:hypothetical protein [Arthrobacter woluwensis]SEB91273.1 hypothetical protein SAMN04489745_1580 [Arthrobacter woluwensis]